MKCSKFQQEMAFYSDGAFPPALRGHFDSCADCQKAYEQTEAVRKLMTLKNFEKADPGFETRCVQNVMRRIREQESRTVSLWDFITGFQPAFRYAAALAVVALVFLHEFSLSNLPVVSPTAMDIPLPAAEQQAQPAKISKPILLFENPAPPMMVFASNQTPDSIQYGTTPSRLVNYEY